MRAVWKGLGACVVAAAIACGGTSSKENGFASLDGGGSGSSGSGGSGSSGSGSSGGSSGGLLGDGGGGSSSGGSNCTGQAADFVYVLSAENDLYSFAPDKKLFTKIGPLGCTTPLSPNSMAVDRNATAYVNYVADDDSTGQIFQVSTTDASCTGPLMTLPSGWERVGMGYSTDNAGSTTETLYVAGVGGGMGLGLLDFGIKTVGPIGPFTGSLAGQNAELTGTGAGTLFGFFTSSPVEVAQIDKANGSTMTPVPMTGVKVPNDWAFSFWGGHFYLYTSQGQGSGNGSNVTDYDPVGGTVNTMFMTAIGFDIVGAGVSTCAPTTAPQ
ncbi:MAG TPA: hypothetical protein VGL81_28210 [Polyangiaceae bacterium]|jgi:hypothetical protein